MKTNSIQAAIIMAAFLTNTAFAAAPVNDVTQGSGNSNVEKELNDIKRLLESRNRMQQRFQNQLTEISDELNQMKGDMEQFDYKINQIENRQRNLFELIEDRKAGPTTKATGSKSKTPVNANEKASYQAAVDLVLINKDFEQAITAFEAFVIDYPNSEYVANSQYWLGQLFYKEKKRAEARNAFVIVTEKFPDSNKRADSLFKIGIIDEYLGKTTSAKTFYEKVLKEYPNSSAANLAKKRMQAL
ncbi:MAG: tol-pal system protein YbgF, partial [Psychromonas sp.]